MSGGGGGGGVPTRLFGRREEEELDDLSNDPGRRSEPEGRRVLSSYGVRRPEELSGGVVPSVCIGPELLLRLAGLELGAEPWNEGAGLTLPSDEVCIAERSSRERLVGKSGGGSLLVDATASWGVC